MTNIQYIIIIKKLIIQGLDFTFITKEVIILVGMTGLILALSMINSKKRLE